MRVPTSPAEVPEGSTDDVPLEGMGVAAPLEEVSPAALLPEVAAASSAWDDDAPLVSLLMPEVPEEVLSLAPPEPEVPEECASPEPVLPLVASELPLELELASEAPEEEPVLAGWSFDSSCARSRISSARDSSVLMRTSLLGPLVEEESEALAPLVDDASEAELPEPEEASDAEEPLPEDMSEDEAPLVDEVSEAEVPLVLLSVPDAELPVVASVAPVVARWSARSRISWARL